MAAYPFFPRFTRSYAVGLFQEAGIPIEGPFAAPAGGFQYSAKEVLPRIVPRFIGIGRYTEKATGRQAYEVVDSPDRLFIDCYHAEVSSESEKLENDPEADARLEWIGYLDLYEKKLVSGQASELASRVQPPEPTIESVRKGAARKARSHAQRARKGSPAPLNLWSGWRADPSNPVRMAQLAAAEEDPYNVVVVTYIERSDPNSKSVRSPKPYLIPGRYEVEVFMESSGGKATYVGIRPLDVYRAIGHTLQSVGKKHRQAAGIFGPLLEGALGHVELWSLITREMLEEMAGDTDARIRRLFYLADDLIPAHAAQQPPKKVKTKARREPATRAR